ncbi:MAG: FHA domain-containing protein [Prevotella sp.]|nr:FHA domain-containing protein [Prevotella sp.]
MKIIKIGSSQSCDLVLDSQYVSSLHAEMTILDDGQIILEDKNSKNGTTVGNKKLEPGRETNVQRGDRISFADVPLVWAKVPIAEKLTAYKSVYNIGSNYRNEIILNSQTVSRFHASVRVGKDGKVYIHDNGSRNGTMVNGVKIAANKDVRVKKGDNIVCGTEDVTDQILAVMPKTNTTLIYAIAGAACLLVLLGIIYAVWPKGSEEPPTAFVSDSTAVASSTPSNISPEKYRNSVVFVGAQYHYIAEFEDNPIPDAWNGKIEDIGILEKTNTIRPYTATAFFLDRNGYMGTNRHVAVPWEYRSKDEDNLVRELIEYRIELMRRTCIYMRDGDERITGSDKLGRDFSKDMMNKFIQTDFGKGILAHLSKYGPAGAAELNKIVSRLNRSRYTITGAIDYIMVGYAGRNYTHGDEFQRCDVISESKDPDIDVALLQLNDKKTPDHVELVFSPSQFVEDRLVPLKDKLFTIGYPAGLNWALDKKAKSLEPSIKETKCSKEPSKYDFELQESSVGGSSGSPIFNEAGHLVGVLWGGTSIAGGFTKAMHAKYLKKLCDEEGVK